MRKQSVFTVLRRWLGCVLVACAPLLACEAAPEIEPTIGLSQSAVVGGQTVETCQYPSTVVVNTCTATLIHPRVVTTAAHCLSGSTATVTFGGYRSGTGGAFKLTGTCKAGAQGSRGGGTKADWGYCVIPEDDRVKQIPITPPLVGCEADRFLKEGATGWVVGFGTTGPDGQGVGIKRAVQVNINKVANGIVDVGDKDSGACHGDSGGPVYVQLGDGTHDWGLRVAGSTSSAGSARCDCTCNTIYVNISNHVQAIEQNEGIDVTPCTDAMGNWAPGPDCNALQTTPMSGSGTFPACMVPRTSAPIDSCSGALPAAGSGGAGALAGAGGRGASAGAGGVAGSAGRGLAGAGGMAGGAAGGPAAGSGGFAAAGGGAGAAGGALAGSSAAGGAPIGVPGNLGSSGAQGVSTAAGSVALGPVQAGGSAVVQIQPPAARGGCSAASGAPSGSRSGLVAIGLALALQVRRRKSIKSAQRR
jgi:hypothetical protein